ncbi:selenide, water dikinase SelD [Acidimangrovimonas sediminis]|uniref:selenide, water dikinase SelD n=1 Tax=Acidimangrovimonas sediminis TaxID=2056283 RepID=UPI000C806798|nr:selenide, water dikinase SelD [Acidimangrovimonas sediminis]
MQVQIPATRDLVLIGGGHAHALVLRRWGMKPLPGVRVTLINPHPTAPYSGMLPGHIAGHYRREELEIDLVRLARHAGARVILGRAEGMDLAARTVAVPGRPPVAYDVASLDIGITTEMPDLAGFALHGAPAKPMDDYAARWEAFVEAAARGEAAPVVVVLGSGIAGVELALASAHRLRKAGVTPSVTIVERAAEALPNIGPGARQRLLAHLRRAGVEVLTGATATEAAAEGLRLSDGRLLAAGFLLGAAGARPQPWLAATGLQLTDGHVDVGPTLQSLSDPAVFAAGDCAHLTHAPRPKAGVFAVREAPFLYDNLRAALGVGRMRAYQPQKDYLKLVSTGFKGAVADKGGLRLNGRWLWHWKNRIDRKFMRRFLDLPQMPAAPLPPEVAAGVAEELAGGKPLCGGCGAKVGPGALRAALSGMPAPQRADTLSGPGDDAAVLAHGAGVQVITTDHLRAFTEDPWLMARIAATHALGDIWAMGAAPQAALAQITLPRLSPALQARTLAEVMEAAGAVFRAAGADLVGGHTSVGSELTLGFTITGLAPRATAKGGAQPGDRLILTKPLGTGTILAAEMARASVPGLSLGRAVAGCFASQQRPLSTEAGILSPVAHAMTDVTGFGLAGHLVEMLDASGCAAELELGAIPFLEGAVALARAGHRSTLYPANRAAVAARMTLPEGPEADLLFDPQTAGGLLAAVPGAEADAMLTALREAGVAAALIGTVTAGAPRVRAV